MADKSKTEAGSDAKTSKDTLERAREKFSEVACGSIAREQVPDQPLASLHVPGHILASSRRPLARGFCGMGGGLCARFPPPHDAHAPPVLKSRRRRAP